VSEIGFGGNLAWGAATGGLGRRLVVSLATKFGCVPSIVVPVGGGTWTEILLPDLVVKPR
jgi:hypothetical protein